MKLKSILLYISLLSYVKFFGLDLGLSDYLDKGYWKFTYLLYGLVILFPLRRRLDDTSKLLLAGFGVILVSTMFNYINRSELYFILPKVFYGYSLLFLYAFSAHRINITDAKKLIYTFAILYSLVSIFYVLGGDQFFLSDSQGSERYGRTRYAGVGEVFLALGTLLIIFDSGVKRSRKVAFLILIISVLVLINMSRHVALGLLLTYIFIRVYRLKNLPRSMLIVLPLLGGFYFYNFQAEVIDGSFLSRLQGLVVYGDQFIARPLFGFGYRSLAASVSDFYIRAHELNLKLVDLGLLGAIFQYGLASVFVLLFLIKSATSTGFKLIIYLLLSLDTLFWEQKGVILFIVLSTLIYEKDSHHWRRRIYRIARSSPVSE